MFAQSLRRTVELLEGSAAQGQDGARGHRLVAGVPLAVLTGEDLGAEVLAVGEHVQHGLVAVLAGADLVDLAVGDEHDLLGGLAGGGDHLAGLELALHEPVGQGAQRGLVVKTAQQREFLQLLGDDADVGSGVAEGDPAVPEGVAQPPVHAVHATGRLHPGQHSQQPPGGDALHLRGRFGRGREISRGRGAQAQLRGFGVGRVRIGRSHDRNTTNHRDEKSSRRARHGGSMEGLETGAKGESANVVE
ncbi:hypothetical protein GCM10027597_60630 [Saccharopolyspora tripterygii]